MLIARRRKEKKKKKKEKKKKKKKKKKTRNTCMILNIFHETHPAMPRNTLTPKGYATLRKNESNMFDILVK